MNSYCIPDAPDIANTLRTGYPNTRRMKARVCPVCDEECDVIYVSRFEGAIGCDNCITSHNVWEGEDEDW